MKILSFSVLQVHGRSVKFETARQFANAILAILDGAMYDEDAYDG